MVVSGLSEEQHEGQLGDKARETERPRDQKDALAEAVARLAALADAGACAATALQLYLDTLEAEAPPKVDFASSVRRAR